MYGRGGLDRFIKAQSLELFLVSLNSAPKTIPKAVEVQQHSHSQNAVAQPQQEEHTQPQAATQLWGGGGQSTWQPPDWAIEPRPVVYYLQVLKEGQVLDLINLNRCRHIFGRQYHTCDFVLDHQSVSRQHAAVILHKNGSTTPVVAVEESKEIKQLVLRTEYRMIFMTSSWFYYFTEFTS